jgi:hypothetical protein
MVEILSFENCFKDLFIFLDNASSPISQQENIWKTSQVISCIRRLRSLIIHPSKTDISTQFLTCLQQSKTLKSNKKTNKG